MPTSLWKYADNTFDSSTQGSWTLMNKIASDHLAKLNAKVGPQGAQDADIVACRDRVNAAVTAFVQAWSRWQNLDASSGAKTDVLGALLNELSSKLIRQWDIAIQGVFMDDTPEYAELLRGGRAPFQSGAIDDRIQAVKTLAERLGSYVQFAALKTTVNDFYTKLKAARDAQKGLQGVRDAASNDAEATRLALAAALYANVGRLMEKHSTEPHRIEDYFDLSLIRATQAAPTAPAPPPPTPTVSPVESTVEANGFASPTPVMELAPRAVSNGSH